MFPEGTRSRDGELGFFKPGLALVARRAKVPILPAAIEGVARLGTAGKKLVPLALKQLSSTSAEARYAAVGFVGTLEPAEAVKQLPAVMPRESGHPVLPVLHSDREPCVYWITRLRG